MSAPGVVDLSLPTDQALLASATPNPQVEAARATSGNPEQVRGLGRQLGTAGAELDELYDRSVRTQRALAGSFTNGGAPVYDEQLHRRQFPAGFRDVGTRLHDVGRRMGAVADELQTTIDEVSGSVDRLLTDLGRRRSAFGAQVDALRVAGGVLPVEVVAGLQARRAVVAAEMQEAVNACGRGVAERVRRYDEVLGGCLPVLGELGRTVGVDTSGTRLHPVLGGRLETSSPAPALPTVEIFPIPEPRAPDRGFTPGPVGPGPLITVPAPGLGAGVQDGPGSGQRVDDPGIRIDRDSAPGSRPPHESGPLGETYQPGVHDPDGLFLPKERRIADEIVGQEPGARVDPRPRDDSILDAKNPDAIVRRSPDDPGTITEFKTLESGSDTAVKNNILSAAKQDAQHGGGDVYIDGREVGLTEAVARHGYARAEGQANAHGSAFPDSVTVILGDGTAIRL